MERLFRFGRHLSVVAIIALTACNASQNVSPNVYGGSNSRLAPNHMGSDGVRPFKAAYSGNYFKQGDCSATATFNYKGSGSAKFVHTSDEQITLLWFCGSKSVNGSAVLIGTNSPRDIITANVSSSNFQGPCYGFSMVFTVTGGTGKFAHASGSGTIAVHTPHRACSIYAYSDKWKGTLKI